MDIPSVSWSDPLQFIAYGGSCSISSECLICIYYIAPATDLHNLAIATLYRSLDEPALMPSFQLDAWTIFSLCSRPLL